MNTIMTCLAPRNKKHQTRTNWQFSFGLALSNRV